MFIPGAIDALGAGDRDGTGSGGPGFIVGGGELGAIVMPGIGAIVAAGAGVACFAGAGVAFFAGACVAIGMPGIGAIAGCAARTGEAVRTIKAAAATIKRVASKVNLWAKRRHTTRRSTSYPKRRVATRGFHFRA